MSVFKYDFLSDPRFAQFRPAKRKIWLSSPTMHGDEQHWVDEAIQTNWVSTVGENINVIEKEMAAYIGIPYAVALSSGTAALHLAMKLAGEKLYGQPAAGHGALEGRKVFCSDMTFAATVNPICYEGGECVFIDTERDSWNMDPEALERAFEMYPEVRLIVAVHLYGSPAKIAEIRRIADKHHALIAGYVEVGETLEHAVHREVKEETGLDISDLRYLGDQPWGISGSHMFAFHATADPNQPIHIQESELTEARWFDRSELAPRGSMISIASELIERFRSLGTGFVRMTGSGSTVFAAFDSMEKARSACAQVPGSIVTFTTRTD